MSGLKLFAAGLVIALGQLSGSFAVAQEAAQRPAKVFTVFQKGAALKRSYSAVVFPSQEVELSFRVSGRVISLPVRGASQVKEGDIIARLDPRDFEATIAQLQSQLDQATAQLQALRTGARAEELAALEAAVAAADAKADQALEQAERSRELAERGVVSKAKLDQDEAALRVAQAELRAQEEQLLIGKSGGRAEEIDAAEAAIRGLEAQLSTARDNLQDTTLTAPYSGIIARRDIDNFTNITAGQSVVLLQALSIINLAFDIPGVDVAALYDHGEPVVQVTFDALPGQTLNAELVEFSTQADAATQTYRARVAVDLPRDSLILPGMVGEIEIEMFGAGGTSQTFLPLSAVSADADGTPFVWIVDGATNTVSQSKVELGHATGAMVEVLSGAQEGDVVVSAGVSQLQEGMTIRPITKIGG